jgi:hypothetical protein
MEPAKMKIKSNASSASMRMPAEKIVEETMALSQKDVRLVLKLACILRN